MKAKHIRTYHRTARLCGIILFSVAVFYAAVCTPVYQWSSADVAVSRTVFPVIWDTLQSVVRFLFYWTVAAFVLFGTASFGKSNRLLLIAGGASLCLHIGSLGVGLLMMRDLDTIASDLLDVALSVALDFCQIALFRLVAYLTMERKAAHTQQRLIPVRAFLASSAIPSLFQIIQRLLYDLSLGGPTGKADLIWMITYYLADFASIAVGYLVILLIADRLCRTNANPKE